MKLAGHGESDHGGDGDVAAMGMSRATDSGGAGYCEQVMQVR
jgi:hypothetical protein